jgi:quercetin dioxygenase-like cupin family protein
MKRTLFMLATALAIGIGLGLLAGPMLQAQPEGTKRTLLRKTDLAGIVGREAVMGLAETAPGAAAGWHYRHGDELGFVMEGIAVLEVEGLPPIALKAGDTNRRCDASSCRRLKLEGY